MNQKPKLMGRKTTIRLDPLQICALDQTARNLGAKLHTNIYRHHVVQGMIGAILFIEPVDRKSVRVMGELKVEYY